MVARLNHHPDHAHFRAVAHPDHILTTVFRRAADLLHAECSCGSWTAQQYTGFWHQPVDFHSAHAAHVEHALTKEPAMATSHPFAPSVRAGALGGAHIGHRIRATTVDGVSIEDTLTRVEHARYGADKEPSVRASFANVQPVGTSNMSAVILGQSGSFKIAADTIVAIVAGPVE